MQNYKVVLIYGRLCAILYIKDLFTCIDPSEAVVTATASFSLYMYFRLRLDRYRDSLGSGLIII